jgi:hypothetical protein
MLLFDPPANQARGDALKAATYTQAPAVIELLLRRAGLNPALRLRRARCLRKLIQWHRASIRGLRQFRQKSGSCGRVRRVDTNLTDDLNLNSPMFAGCNASTIQRCRSKIDMLILGGSPTMRDYWERVGLVAFWLMMCVRLSGAVAAEDATLEKGYVSKNADNKGIVLYLHGCDGGFNASPAADWHDWLERSGFKVFAPNSFAEERPPVSCSAPYLYKDEIYAIRLRQTVRVLEQIIEGHRGVPIYVWGHSEGGGVANLLSQKVEGILTTGYPCGFKRTPVTQIRKDVRVLVVMGSERFDYYLLEAHLESGFATLADLCRETFRAHPKASWKQFYNLGHAPYPGNLELFAAVNEFLHIKTPW